MGMIEDVRTTASPIISLGGGFMLDGATTEHGGAFGLDFGEYYAMGRGGVLGDVDADVITSAFVVFAPAMVRTMWEAARAKREPAAAALSYAQACQAWGRLHFSNVQNLDETAALLEQIAVAASPIGAPLFAGWRAISLPLDAPARVAQLLHVLRELRGGLHGVAILGAGLAPIEAVMVYNPGMAPMFGWADGAPATDATKAAHAKAELATDELVAPAYECLGDTGRARLVVLLNELDATSS